MVLEVLVWRRWRLASHLTSSLTRVSFSSTLIIPPTCLHVSPYADLSEAHVIAIG